MTTNIEELIDYQKQVLLDSAKKIVPTITMDDLWQPNDFPELDNHPLFRYEEGVLHGMLMVETFLKSSGNN